MAGNSTQSTGLRLGFYLTSSYKAYGKHSFADYSNALYLERGEREHVRWLPLKLVERGFVVPLSGVAQVFTTLDAPSNKKTLVTTKECTITTGVAPCTQPYGHLLETNLAQECGEECEGKQGDITVAHMFVTAEDHWALGSKRHSPASNCIKSRR